MIVGIERRRASTEEGRVEGAGCAERGEDGVLEPDRVVVAGGVGEIGDDVAVGRTECSLEDEEVVARAADERVNIRSSALGLWIDRTSRLALPLALGSADCAGRSKA